jgi:precorrin-6B methylase 2
LHRRKPVWQVYEFSSYNSQPPTPADSRNVGSLIEPIRLGEQLLHLLEPYASLVPLVNSSSIEKTVSITFRDSLQRLRPEHRFDWHPGWTNRDPDTCTVPTAGVQILPDAIIITMNGRCVAVLLTLAVCAPAFQDTHSLDNFKKGDAYREREQHATDLLATLQLQPGDWVADVGALGGYYSVRLSEIVGPKGHVFAEDIRDAAIEALRARVSAFNLKNVELVKGEPIDPKLPPSRLAAVLIVDTYHHFTDHEAMLEKILASLAPGGRLVIADYSRREDRTLPRAEQLKIHQINPELVRGEVTSAGFQVVKCDDPFARWVAAEGNPRGRPVDFWVLVAVRPK